MALWAPHPRISSDPYPAPQSVAYRTDVEGNGFHFVDVSEGDWRQLRGAWLDMVGARSADDLESLDDALARTESAWRELARNLTDTDCFGQALVDESGCWLGFVTGYLDELALDRNVFVTHVHALDGDLETEALLLDRVAEWAGVQVADSVVVGIREDCVDLLRRFEDHGFRRTGVRRRSELGVGEAEIELSLALAALMLPRGGTDSAMRQRSTSGLQH